MASLKNPFYFNLFNSNCFAFFYEFIIVVLSYKPSRNGAIKSVSANKTDVSVSWVLEAEQVEYKSGQVVK